MPAERISLLVIFPMGMSAGASSQAMAGHSLQASGFGEYLSEYNTGEVLYQHNADAKHEKASTLPLNLSAIAYDASLADTTIMPFIKSLTLYCAPASKNI